jgi:hypothetical protein
MKDMTKGLWVLVLLVAIVAGSTFLFEQWWNYVVVDATNFNKINFLDGLWLTLGIGFFFALKVKGDK